MRLITETSKMIAFTEMWDEICQKRYNVEDPKFRRFRYGVQVNSLGLTAQQPENNIARTGFQALAGVLGGTQSLHTNSMDETLALPSEKAAEIAKKAYKEKRSIIDVAEEMTTIERSELETLLDPKNLTKPYF